MLLFTDGFDSMAAIADAAAKGWSIGSQGAGNWTFLSTGGVNGGGAIQCEQDDLVAVKAIRPANAGNNTARLAVWFKSGGSPGAEDSFIRFVDSTALRYMHFFLTSAGEIRAGFSNNSPTLASQTVATTSGAGLHDGNWHFVEIYFLSSHLSDGRIKVKVDNVALIDVTAVNAQSGSASLALPDLDIAWLSTPDSSGIFDDLVVWDDVAGDGFTGELVNPIIIGTTRPDAAGDSAAFTVTGAASNFEAVDDSPYNDDDATYVTADVVGEKDLYNFAAITPTPSTIKAVSVNMVMRTEAGAEVGVKSVTKNGGVEASSETKLFSNVGYTTHQRFHSVDPSTSAAWTEAGLNTTQFGPEMVS